MAVPKRMNAAVDLREIGELRLSKTNNRRCREHGLTHDPHRRRTIDWAARQPRRRRAIPMQAIPTARMANVAGSGIVDAAEKWALILEPVRALR